jgi:hypothetical protein
MRNIIAAVTLTGVWLLSAFFWLHQDPGSSRIVDTDSLQFDDRLTRLESSLTESLRAAADQREQLSAAQSDVNNVLAQLRVQIAALTDEGTLQQARLARADEDTAASESGEAHEEAAEAQPSAQSEPSEVQVGELMDRRFDDGEWDMNASELARSQAADIVATLPGVNLADMVCNDKLCRAMFIKLDGGVPDIGDVWGHPPFMNDGFTVHQEDGSVVLYYAQPGMELDQLREQLIASQ